jgi:DNA-binding XRE family transcriptional regulator
MSRKPTPKWEPADFIAWRAARGFTQAEAADALGYANRASICKLELGTSQITPRIVIACQAIAARSDG